MFSNSSVLGKSVFEKLRFRDGLAWTEGLTRKLKLHFQNPPAQRGQSLSVRLRLSESNIVLLLIFGRGELNLAKVKQRYIAGLKFPDLAKKLFKKEPNLTKIVKILMFSNKQSQNGHN